MNAEDPAPGAPERDIFPILTAAQIERLAAARARAIVSRPATFCSKQGGTNRPLMVVLEGEIEILSDRDTLVTVHRPGNFSGDVDLIAGQPAVVRARARGAGRILEVPAERVRSLVLTDPELSQIFLRAFILRRTLLMTPQRGKRRPHRIEALGGHPDAAGVPDAQQPAVRVPRRRPRCGRAGRRSRGSAWAWTTCPSSSAAASRS